MECKIYDAQLLSHSLYIKHRSLCPRLPVFSVFSSSLSLSIFFFENWSCLYSYLSPFLYMYIFLSLSLCLSFYLPLPFLKWLQLPAYYLYGKHRYFLILSLILYRSLYLFISFSFSFSTRWRVLHCSYTYIIFTVNIGGSILFSLTLCIYLCLWFSFIVHPSVQALTV